MPNLIKEYLVNGFVDRGIRALTREGVLTLYKIMMTSNVPTSGANAGWVSVTLARPA
jgi:hypothetical protein